jgi:uncharacterized protein
LTIIVKNIYSPFETAVIDKTIIGQSPKGVFMHNVCHWELQTINPDTAIKFYGSLFGWKLQYEKQMNYVLVDTGTPPGGGMNVVKSVTPGPAVLVILVEDVENTLTKATGLGAKVITPKHDIPGVGFYGAFQDPEGNQIGIFTPLPGSMPH